MSWQQIAFERCCDNTHRIGWVESNPKVKIGRFVKFAREPNNGKHDAWWRVVAVYPIQTLRDNPQKVYTLKGYWAT